MFDKKKEEKVSRLTFTATVTGKNKDGNNIVEYDYKKENFPWVSIPEAYREFRKHATKDLLSK